MTEHRSVLISRAIQSSILETLWRYVESNNSTLENNIQQDLTREIPDITKEELIQAIECLYASEDEFEFEIDVSGIQY